MRRVVPCLQPCCLCRLEAAGKCKAVIAVEETVKEIAEEVKKEIYHAQVREVQLDKIRQGQQM